MFCILNILLNKLLSLIYLKRKIKLNGIVLSTDDYFINKKGVYVFDKRKLNDAHSFTKLKGMIVSHYNFTIFYYYYYYLNS
jgi:hypothetical protein